MKETIELFKTYLNFYKLLEGIQSALDKAIIYGYNPKDLNQRQIIKDGDYLAVTNMK